MKPCIVYIFGLFENKNSFLFKSLKHSFCSHRFNCQKIELYPNTHFGSYSFLKEIKRIQKLIKQKRPVLIIAHSLGAYVALQLKIYCSLILLDPSLAISDIIFPNLENNNNVRTHIYNDGEKRTKLSKEFIRSLSCAPSIKKITQAKKNNNINIITAGRGGCKVAEQYYIYMPYAKYTLILNADHDFSKKQDINKIITIIKKQLGVIPSCD